MLGNTDLARSNYRYWLELLTSAVSAGANSPVCCVGSVLPTLFDTLFIQYSYAVRAYTSMTRSLGDAGNTMTLMYKHTQLHPEDLNKVVVHYGHVFPFRLGEFGCMNLGYDIYCPDQIVLPEELLHEVMHVKQFVEQAGRSLSMYGRMYLQQYCDTGAYSAMPWEKEAYAIERAFFTPIT
ncbi:hypothetical protein OEZ86_011892 [Tetradesmus obliquus]|nr:hypothetical protein OEZ86_011892 [Tetradesmus obliquus]